jgi:hypothetical protein
MADKPTDNTGERVEGPKPDEAVTGGKAGKPDVKVDKNAGIGEVDGKDIAEGEATQGGYG